MVIGETTRPAEKFFTGNRELKTMFRLIFRRRRPFLLLFVFLFVWFKFGVISAGAQTTEFTYQGRLLDGPLPATANYDFEFRLFDAETGGAVLASQQRLGVA